MKIKTFILAMLIVPALTACGKKDENKEASTVPVAATAPVEPVAETQPVAPAAVTPSPEGATVQGETDMPKTEADAPVSSDASAATDTDSADEEDVTPSEDEIIPSDGAESAVPDAAAVEEGEEADESAVKDGTVAR